MDESLLEQMATTTQGAYVPAQTLRYDLGQIYDDQLARLTQGDISTEQRKRYREQFQMFAIPAFLLLLLDMWIPGYRRRQTSDREVTA